MPGPAILPGQLGYPAKPINRGSGGLWAGPKAAIACAGPGCSVVWVPSRADARYCSTKCRVRAKRARDRAIA